MDIAAQQGAQPVRPDTRTTAKVIAGGSAMEGLIGAGVAALAIIGLANIFPFWMAAIATIAMGAALLFEGGAISSRMSSLMESDRQGHFDVSEIGGGMTAGFIAGLAGITLGILALLGVFPTTLLAISVIVFGGALVIGSSTASKLNYLAAERYGTENAKVIAREALGAAAQVQLLAGIGIVVLGILALVDEPQFTFILVGLLAAGSAALISGSAISSRLTSMFRR